MRNPARAVLLRLPKGCDIHAYLTEYCERENLRFAAVSLIGATSKVTIGYYDQRSHDYHQKSFLEEMEIVSCSGNVSLKDGKPFLHLHAVMGDTQLRCFGGHLFPGSEVFAAEAYLQELSGEPLTRGPDESTGLALWSCPS